MNAIEACGDRMAYQRQGSGPWALLVHGWPTSSFVWRALLRRLGEMRTVIAPDLIGFGESDKPEDGAYTFRFHAERIAALVEAEGMDKLDLVVHDIGGSAALLWAMENVEKLRSITILSTLTTPDLTLSDRMLCAFLRTRSGQRMWSSPKTFAYVLRRAAPRASLAAQTVAVYRAQFEKTPALLWRTLAAALESRHELAGLLPRMAMLTIPVFLLYGDEDEVCGSYMQRLQEALPGAYTQVLQGCGHLVQEDAPEEVAAILCGFWRRASAPISAPPPRLTDAYGSL
jgi:pimeloyl-ACP methyl ester carboxylesterase